MGFASKKESVKQHKLVWGNTAFFFGVYAVKYFLAVAGTVILRVSLNVLFEGLGVHLAMRWPSDLLLTTSLTI